MKASLQDKLDSDARAVLDLIEASGRPPLNQLSVAQAREAVCASLAVLGKAPPPVREHDCDIAGPGGSVPVRIYRPLGEAGEAALPALLYIHGGGWMLGDFAYGAWFCASLAQLLGIAVVSVDFRLAPEHPYPAGLDDCMAVLRHLHGHADTLAIEGGRIAIAGDSAGGNLAAACALIARDEGISLKAQILIYPVTDLLEEQESYARNAEGFGLTADVMRWFKSAYRNGADAADWRVSPLRAERMDALAPALVLTCGFDPLYAEGNAYAERLARAGVPVLHIQYRDQIHGFLMWAEKVAAAEQALAQIAGELRHRLFA
ncbi:MAG: alpha/beta hydrolase [Sphingobium phenoxybenzoativorans]